MAKEKTSRNNYGGKFVATASFYSRKMVTSGRDPKDVRRRAVDKGVSAPVIHFVPDKGTCFIL